MNNPVCSAKAEPPGGFPIMILHLQIPLTQPIEHHWSLPPTLHWDFPPRSLTRRCMPISCCSMALDPKEPSVLFSPSRPRYQGGTCSSQQPAGLPCAELRFLCPMHQQDGALYWGHWQELRNTRRVGKWYSHSAKPMLQRLKFLLSCKSYIRYHKTNWIKWWALFLKQFRQFNAPLPPLSPPPSPQSPRKLKSHEVFCSFSFLPSNFSKISGQLSVVSRETQNTFLPGTL